MTTISIEKSKENTKNTWLNVCKLNDLVLNSGVCVLVESKQIAVFAISNKADGIQLFACDNFDPIGKANVMSRGLLSSTEGEICICSPLYKQHYSLVDGRCLEDEEASVNVYPIQVESQDVQILVPVQG